MSYDPTETAPATPEPKGPVGAREAQILYVAEAEDGIRLDRWFRRRWPHLSNIQVQKMARGGQIRVDGARIKPEGRLTAGAAVRVPPIPEPIVRAPGEHMALTPADIAFAKSMVIYEDDLVIALNKPWGLAVQGGTKTTRHVDRLLSAWGEGMDRPRLVHRLDRDTSGCLVLARTPGTAAKLAAAFRGRDVSKTYWAVVAGRPVPVEGRIDLPLLRYTGPRGERSVPAARDDKEGARAVTDYATLDHAGQKLAWMELSPITGRTHQLRVHCVALGAPIVGDSKYHEPDQNGAGTALIEGLPEKLHLHARALDIPHPAGGRLVVEAELPPHMQETFSTLGFHARPAQAPRRA